MSLLEKQRIRKPDYQLVPSERNSLPTVFSIGKWHLKERKKALPLKESFFVVNLSLSRKERLSRRERVAFTDCELKLPIPPPYFPRIRWATIESH